MNEQIVKPEVNEAFQELNKYFLANGFYFRLIMSDDLINQGEVRQRAKDKVVQGDEKFFYGCSLPASIQDIVDNLVRRHKPDLLALVDGLTDEQRSEVGITVYDDIKIKAYLFVLDSCGMGFYVSRRCNIPRDQRQPRSPAMDKLKKRINSTAAENQHDRPKMRRQFVNLATIRQ